MNITDQLGEVKVTTILEARDNIIGLINVLEDKVGGVG